jgi:hypothetical protein
MSDPAPRRRRLPAWLPLAGAFVGFSLLAIRLATLPLDGTTPYLVVLAVAVAITAAALTGRVIARRSRMRAAVAAHPQSLLLPIVGNVDTSAATRWLAEHLGDPGLALRPERNPILAVDASGLRILDGGSVSDPIPAGTLTVLPLTTVRAGWRRLDALALGVTVGDVVAPLPLVPARSSIFASRALDDAELLEVSARIRSALDGDPVTPGWPY